MKPLFGLIANLANRRTSLFLEAAADAGLPEPVCVGWDELLADGRALDRLARCALVPVSYTHLTLPTTPYV